MLRALAVINGRARQQRGSSRDYEAGSVFVRVQSAQLVHA